MDQNDSEKGTLDNFVLGDKGEWLGSLLPFVETQRRDSHLTWVDQSFKKPGFLDMSNNVSHVRKIDVKEALKAFFHRFDTQERLYEVYKPASLRKNLTPS